MLVVGCILPLAFVSAFLIFNFYEHEQDQLINNGISRARAMIYAVDRGFASTQAALQALATSHRLAHGDLSGFHRRAIEELPNIRAENIVVLDATGQLLLTTARRFGEPLPKAAAPAILKRTLEMGKPGVSDLFFGPESDHLVIAIPVPVKLDGSTIYTLMATVSPAQVSTVLTEQELPASWRAAITDSTGNLVARNHDIESFLGKKVGPNVLQRMSVSDEGGFENKTLDGVPAITIYSRSRSTKWAVVLGIPIDELTAGLRQTLIRLIIATFSALVIGLLLAWYIGGRVARSVTALVKPALALGSGETITMPALHFKEANELGRALLDAATTLRQSRYEAHHDVLTGLANRTLFHTIVNQQLALCQRNNGRLAILYIDLDGFKAVNDTHGHAMGDQLLHAVSVRIKGAIRNSDIAARFGGDEFAIALIQSDIENAKAFACRLIETISDTYQIGKVEAQVSASIGVAGYPVSAKDIDTLLKNADQAMYKAKALGKRRVCVA